MYSVEDKLCDVEKAGVERWKVQPPSQLLDHGRDCCRVARAWFVSLDYSLDSVLASADRFRGPGWIRGRYPWGPSRWPLSWCEAVVAAHLDCGALTALAHEVFTARGLICLPAQVVQRFSTQDTRQWRKRWGSGPGLFEWTAGRLIYHEAAAILVRDRWIKVWDPTHNWWIPADQSDGYGSTLLIRVSVADPEIATDALHWGSHRLRPNIWEEVGGRGAQEAGRTARAVIGCGSVRTLSGATHDAGHALDATVRLDEAAAASAIFSPRRRRGGPSSPRKREGEPWPI